MKITTTTSINKTINDIIQDWQVLNGTKSRLDTKHVSSSSLNCGRHILLCHIKGKDILAFIDHDIDRKPFIKGTLDITDNKDFIASLIEHGNSFWFN
jgi:hypothetical protein